MRLSTGERPFFMLDKVPMETPVALWIWLKVKPFESIAKSLQRCARLRAAASSRIVVHLPARLEWMSGRQALCATIKNTVYYQ